MFLGLLGVEKIPHGRVPIALDLPWRGRSLHGDQANKNKVLARRGAETFCTTLDLPARGYVTSCPETCSSHHCHSPMQPSTNNIFVIAASQRSNVPFPPDDIRSPHTLLAALFIDFIASLSARFLP